MPLRIFLQFDYDDYASLDDTSVIPVALTSREASVCATALQLLLFRDAWDADDAEYDDIQATIADLISEVNSAI